MSKVPEGVKFTTDNAAEMGAKGGKAKAGSKHLSTIIQELSDDIDWSLTTLKNKEELQAKYGKNGFKAMCYVALTKAMTGDTRAMDFLAKYGYGNKLDITSNGENITPVALVQFIDADSTSPDTN